MREFSMVSFRKVLIPSMRALPSWWIHPRSLHLQILSHCRFSSVQFSHSVMSNSLRLHELQHVGPPCPLPTSRVYSNSCPLSWWYHPTISSTVVPFSSCPQSFPASGSFQMSALRIRWPKNWSFSFNISPSNEHPGLISFRMNWLDLLAVQGTLKSLLQHHSSKASILLRSAFFIVQLSHPYMTSGKTIALTLWVRFQHMNLRGWEGMQTFNQSN